MLYNKCNDAVGIILYIFFYNNRNIEYYKTYCEYEKKILLKIYCCVQGDECIITNIYYVQPALMFRDSYTVYKNITFLTHI